MVPFNFFFIFFVFIISLELHICGNRVDDSNYTELHPYFYFALQVFRDAVGDPAPPDMSFWEDRVYDSKIHVIIMQYFGWFVWIFSVFVNMIILLNFIIALINSSYESVSTKSNAVVYGGRCDVVYDVALVMHNFKHLFGDEERAQVFTLVSNVD